MQRFAELISRRPRHGCLLVVLAACCVTGAGLRADDWPRPSGKVNDFAKLLKTPQREALEASLLALERETSAEIAVATVRDLAGRSVEDYANALFNEWGIGKNSQDNGVLILVAVGDRTMRIEVGYGLEGVLPDGLAGAIIRETFTPAFAEGRYADGIAAGTARVADIVRRNQTLTLEQRQALDDAQAEAGKSWAVVVALGMFVAFTAFHMGTGLGAKTMSELASGTSFTALGLLFGAIGAPRPGFWLLGVLAVTLCMVGFVIGRRPAWRRDLRHGSKGAGGSGWVMGGSGVSRGSGSSRSGGSRAAGFSGGRSGGGGASGRW